MKIRTGFGYDVHPFETSRKLILGGVEIPFEKGLKGHSDADVLVHAICDAILGALALGDIGKYFPDNDDMYKNVDSCILLEKVVLLMTDKNYSLGNLDATIAMERPKLAPFIIEMREKLAKILKAEIDQISIKATTTEKLGFVGRQEGAEAFATVLLLGV